MIPARISQDIRVHRNSVSTYPEVSRLLKGNISKNFPNIFLEIITGIHLKILIFKYICPEIFTAIFLGAEE